MHMPGKPEKIMGSDVTAGEVMKTVVKDYPYYLRSGGGLTLSGGEALGQPAFARALFMLAHDNGINTCIETTGYASTATVSDVIPLADTVLMDIKHMNPEKHKAYTGVSNEPILRNAPLIASLAKSYVVRVPVIPGFNDTAEEIRDIARFAAKIPGASRLHLLPYHRLGQDKYAALGREYTLAELTPPTREHMEYLLSVACESGLFCQIGG